MEAVIACGILVTAVSGGLTLTQSSINAAVTSRNHIMAYNLAREGIEVVREIRDSNWLSSQAWDTGVVGTGDRADVTAIPVFAPRAADGVWTWSLNYGPSDFTDSRTTVYRYPSVSGTARAGLLVQGLTQPSGTADSGFRRYLTLDALCQAANASSSTPTVLDYTLATQPSHANRCVPSSEHLRVGFRVTSYVSWVGRGGVRKSISVSENIFDWR